MDFETVKEGPRAGELVRLPICATAMQRDATYPRNPYATGYGNRIPTQWRVKTIDNKWRRVYAVCYSNVSTLYVFHDRKPTIVDMPF